MDIIGFIPSIANLGVAIGTILLAYFSYKNIRSSEEQIKFMRNQTRLLQSREEPHILIESKEFAGNKIRLYLSNYGEGTAYEVAVQTRFFITKVVLTDDSVKLLKETPKEQREGAVEVMVTFELAYPLPSLRLEKAENEKSHFARTISGLRKRLDYHTIYPSSATTFIFNVENEQSILKSGEGTKCFEFEPYFFVTTKANEDQTGPGGFSGRGFLFDELKDFLLKNNIKFIGITFNLVSRDKIGTVYHHQKIDSCIVDLYENKTIEEAINSKRKVHFVTLGWSEIQKDVKWLPSSSYDNARFRTPD